MAYFFLKVIPPRSTFGEDANENELAKMHEHFGYWLDLTNRGIAVVFGPVLDAEGIYGMGIVEMPDEPAARALADEDPAVIARVVRITVSSMRIGAIRGAASV
jgi:uncharacterized protein YciI